MFDQPVVKTDMAVTDLMYAIDHLQEVAETHPDQIATHADYVKQAREKLDLLEERINRKAANHG